MNDTIHYFIFQNLETGVKIKKNKNKTEPLPPKGGRFNQRLKPPKVG